MPLSANCRYCNGMSKSEIKAELALVDGEEGVSTLDCLGWLFDMIYTFWDSKSNFIYYNGLISLSSWTSTSPHIVAC